MEGDVLERIEPLFPLDFFSLSFEITYATTFRQLSLLPRTGSFLAEESFADLEIGWNESGILCKLLVHQPFEECFFPKFADGDAFELFIDTRDMKSAGFLTRFCHHFVILPQQVGEIRAQELTHFRTEDTHPLCDPEEIRVEGKFGKREYQLQITIPTNCLHGYDPTSFNRLGVSYRIHRFKGLPQHLSLSSKYYQVEQEAALWGSATLNDAGKQ